MSVDMSGVCGFWNEIIQQCAKGEHATYPGSTFFIDPQGMDNWQLACMFLLYGYVLFLSADMIGDGAELLLLIPAYADMVGSMVLPILGAIPDGMIVLFSGMGPLAVAQENVAVGVGGLAGSTIMLLTLPWILSVYAAQVDMKDGEMLGYKAKSGQKMNTNETGCQFQAGVTKNASLMFLTSLSYFVIQIPAYLVDDQKTKAEYQSQGDYLKAVIAESGSENQWALIGVFTTTAFFILYLYLQYLAATKKTKEDQESIPACLKALLPPADMADFALAGKLEEHGCATYVMEYRKNAAERSSGQQIEVVDYEDWLDPQRVIQWWRALVAGNGCKSQSLNKDEIKAKLPQNLMTAAENLFKKHKGCDVKSGKACLTQHEMHSLLRDSGLPFTKEAFATRFKQADTDQSLTMDELEFQNFFYQLITSPKAEFLALFKKASGGDDDDDEEEEENETPDDIKSLPPGQQHAAIMKRSFQQMITGTLLVLVFSDPMVDVLSQIGTATGVPCFYVSFLLAPLASNASELVSSMKLASKKTSTSITQSLQCLEGAACMNNTFCLGIFFFLIYYQGLAWKFTAETLSIFFSQLAVFVLVQKGTIQKKRDGIIIFLCYPVSLISVYALENCAHLD